MSAKLKNIIIVSLAALYLFGAFAICLIKPTSEYSTSERRELESFPELSIETLLSGKFMSKFEDYTLDQFPLRDSFRTWKSILAFYVFGHMDNNDIYLHDGYASKLEYPVKEESINKATGIFESIYNSYLKDTNCKPYFSLIPDKNYFMAEDSGHLALDYEHMTDLLKEKTSYMEYIDITGLLELSDYYKTDTHWRNECIYDVADALASAMGTELKAEYEKAELDNEFYGVYYGQSALPLSSETIYYMTNETLSNVKVFDHENNKEISVFDMNKAFGNDPYEMFLSGSLSLITIENPNATTDKELIIFRDSFGSSITPYLIEGYEKITLVDIRYLSSKMLHMFIEFDDQDVLFLYSTLVLNNAEIFK